MKYGNNRRGRDIMEIRGSIHNIPDWWRHLYSSCSSAKHRAQQAKLWSPGSTATFCGDCVTTCEDVAQNFGENRPGCFIMTTPRLTLPLSPSSFWRNTKWLSSATHRTALIWLPVTFLFPKMKFKLKGRRFDTIEIRSNRRECVTLWQKRSSRKLSKNGGDGGTGVYMREGTTSRVMATDRPYGEFYDVHSVSPEYFG
jgi:hypothetical protein